MAHYLLQFFQFGHLREDLRETSEQFGELAQRIDIKLPDNPEKTTALRKLLEAKDCAVRAVLFEP
jgi:ferritin-like protein